ncbi:MAG: hypothetical protein LBQ92_03650 [Propionibacteriaceae bacterium]|jgi:hypothetical protein|nr:hypothetical protein [Propionibacteriaceae bacterium]
MAEPPKPTPAYVYFFRRLLMLLAFGVVLTGLVFLGVAIHGTLQDPSKQQTAPPTATATVAETPSQAPTPTGPVACEGKSLKLTVAGFAKLKVTGSQTFNLTIKNKGKEACLLKVDGSSYTLTVVSGSDRIWSTADCPEWVPEADLTLAAGASHEFSVDWTLRRSDGSCKLVKKQLKPGTYVANASFADATGRQVLLLVS